ncbi:MAG: ABC transporter permease subunit [Candidatus Dormiibacterota bacterium]
MAATRSRSLIPWALRSHRNGAIAFGAGLALLVAITGPSYVAAAKAIAGGLKTLAAQALPFAQQFAFLTGPVARLDTVGGYLSYKVFGSITLIVALYAALQGTQVLRGSESKGLFDLWFAAGRSRTEIFRDRVLSFLAALLAVVALIYVGTGLSGSLSGEQLWASALGQCIAVGAVGLVAFSIALLVSQFLHSTRTAAGLASVYLVAAYFVANISDSLGAASFLRFLSPFFYYLQERTLVPGTSVDIAALVVALALAATLTTLAWRLFLARDAEGVTLAGIRRTRALDYTVHRSRIVRRWLWLSWIWEQRLALASWCVGIFTLTAVEAAVVPTALNLIKNDHGSFSKLASVASLTEGQYVAFLLTFVIVVVAGFMVTEVAHWVGDASQHRIEALLAQPVGLRRFVAERVGSLVVMSGALAGALVLGAMTGAAIGGYSLNGGGLLRTFVTAILFGFGVGGVGLLVVAVFRSAASTAVIGALLVACFFLTTISGLLRWPNWTNRPSVFDAFGSPYQGWPATGGLVYLGALGVVGAAATYLVMKRGARIAA